MRTTIDLTPEAYQLAKAIAREREESLGRVVSELILRQPKTRKRPRIWTSAAGFPVFSSGRPVTSEDVRAMIDEDENES